MSRRNMISINEVFYYVAFALRIFIGTLQITVAGNTTTGNIVYQIGWYVALFLAIVSILLQSNTSVMKWIVGIVLMLMFGASYLFIQTSQLIEILIYVFAAHKVSFKRLMKIFIVIHSVVAIYCVLGSNVGWIENMVWSSSGRVRNALGYRYVTYISKVFFFVTVYYISIRQKKYTLPELLITEAINLYIFEQTNSRTTFALLAVFPVLCYLLKFRKKPVDFARTKRRFIYEWCYVICAIVCFAVIYGYMHYNNLIFQAMDYALSNRLMISANDINEYGINLFGHSVEWVGQVAHSLDNSKTINFIDCSYLNIVLSYGVVAFVVFMGMSVIIMKYNSAQNSQILMILQFMCAVHFMIEPQLLDLTYCIFMLWFFTAFDYLRMQRKAKRRRRHVIVADPRGQTVSPV